MTGSVSLLCGANCNHPHHLKHLLHAGFWSVGVQSLAQIGLDDTCYIPLATLYPASCHLAATGPKEPPPRQAARRATAEAALPAAPRQQPRRSASEDDAPPVALKGLHEAAATAASGSSSADEVHMPT